MKKTSSLSVALISLFVMVIVIYSCSSNNPSKGGEAKSDSTATVQNGAFQNHRDSVPSSQQYSNPLFVLSHDYPTTFRVVVNPPWQQTLNNKPMSDITAFAYMDALKNYVAPNVLPFFQNNATWTSAKYGWFNEPWVGSQREAILGTYLGNGNPANMFKTLKEDEAGYALVLYDSTAAYTVGQIWGKTGQRVNLLNNATQFPEGSVIVKFAFSNINSPQWPVMHGAQTFYVYDTIPTTEDSMPGYQMRKVSFFQMDVIVKDSIASPKTGWVYSTFVYDKDASVHGKDSSTWFWDKMVPLGAMWGDDPDVNSALHPEARLLETVINPKAPAYSKETLGWGGRLSGPNDGAVAQEATDVTTGKQYKNLALSSCMSCHSPAQDTFKSFLLPGPFPPPDTLLVYTPGSANWNLWFRNNAGNVPFNAGQVAMDYDMVMALKSIPAYLAAQPAVPQNKLLKSNIEKTRIFRRHKTRSQFWH